MKAKKNDPTIMLSAIAIYNELVDVYSMRNEYESNSVYEELKNTNGETFAQIYVSALAKMDQISYDAENSESDFSDKFLDSLYYSHSEMNTLSPSSSTGYVKYGFIYIPRLSQGSIFICRSTCYCYNFDVIGQL